MDLNKAVTAISKIIGATKDRGAWVKALLEQTKSKTRGNYNVMVFNMQQNYEFNPPPNTFKFVQVPFRGGLGGDITYGVWVFRSGGVFKNQGDGGFINWAFYGHSARNGGTVTFPERPGRPAASTKAPGRRSK